MQAAQERPEAHSLSSKLPGERWRVLDKEEQGQNLCHVVGKEELPNETRELQGEEKGAKSTRSILKSTLLFSLLTSMLCLRDMRCSDPPCTRIIRADRWALKPSSSPVMPVIRCLFAV